MDKFSFITLWDTYKLTLTANQQEITNLYFNLDLTVSEIAAEKNISRQAVSECLKGCKKQLEELEEKLHVCEQLRRICLEQSFMMTAANKWAESFKTSHPQFISEITSLQEILVKDYSEEVKETLKKPENVEFLNKDYTEDVYGHKKTGEE